MASIGKRIILLAAVAAALAASGCNRWCRTGTETGAAPALAPKGSGAGVVTGVLLGATLGGAPGAAIGFYMDREAKEVKADLPGATVERLGEGIKAVYPANQFFIDTSTTFQDGIQSQLNNLAKTVNADSGIDILIAGYTDSSGNRQADLLLSQQWTDAIVNYLKTAGVSANRMTASGYGEDQPFTTNTTAQGHALNRRIEIGIYANNYLKKRAVQGRL